MCYRIKEYFVVRYPQHTVKVIMTMEHRIIDVQIQNNLPAKIEVYYSFMSAGNTNTICNIGDCFDGAGSVHKRIDWLSQGPLRYINENGFHGLLWMRSLINNQLVEELVQVKERSDSGMIRCGTSHW